VTVRPSTAACLALVAFGLALAGCGRKTDLETPVSLDQTLPWTEAGRRAMDPPRDSRGRPEAQPSQPRPTPAMQSTPFDFLLN
jgi:predicted small lipoprotein YifL